MTETADDIGEIRALIEAQFASLNWSEDHRADWHGLATVFRDDATLIPAARPAQRRTVAEFRDRLEQLEQDGTLRTFSERMTQISVQVAGTVAVAMAGCAMTENGTTITNDVSAFLLVKEDGAWRIANQAWDLVDHTAIRTLSQSVP